MPLSRLPKLQPSKMIPSKFNIMMAGTVTVTGLALSYFDQYTALATGEVCIAATMASMLLTLPLLLWSAW